MLAKLVSMQGVEIVDVSELAKQAIAYTPSYAQYRARGCVAPREELDCRPIIVGYLSPMWDGDMLRYETPEVYDLLSR